MTQLRVALLGVPRVERGGRVVTFDTRKAMAMLAYLAVTAQPQSRDVLAGLLWPDHPQAQARGALRRTLSVLGAATGGATVVADRATVALRSGTGLWLDVSDFLAHLSRHGHDHARTQGNQRVEVLCQQCVADLEAAVALYRDDFMAGFTLRDSPDFDEWQALQADDLRRQLAGALRLLVRARIQTGDLDDAITAARRWLSLDPLHEPAHAMLMRLYAWTGQRSAALQQYRECVRILQRELGVPPLSQTSALDEAIRSGRLARPTRTTPSGPGTASGRGTAPAGTSADRPATAPPPSAVRLPMVGRDQEVELLDRMRAEVGGGGGRLVVLSGEAGIGKSRLVAEVAGNLRSQGPVVVVRCHEGEAGLAFGVISDVVRSALRADEGAFDRLPPAWRVEVIRLLPELATAADAQPPPLDSPGAQSRFRTALVGALTAAIGARRSRQAPMVAIEDVQWADESSADVLAYLVRRLREVDVLLMLTWRPDQLPAASPVPAALSAAVRDGVAVSVELGRLDEAAVAALAAAGLPDPPAPALVTRLWRETGGLPLFVTEYVEAFRQSGQVPDEQDWQLPGGVRELLRARLDRLGETTLQVLAAGAVLGGDLAPTLLQDTSGRGEEEVVSALEDGLRQAVIVETDKDGGTYEFGHDALRRLVYETTSLARRRLLHGRAADALAGRRDPPAGLVAAHLRRAGRDTESAEWSWRAAQQARGLYAHGEALEHLAAAAALAHPGHEVHQATGDVLTALGRYREALVAYEQAAANVPVELAQSDDQRGDAVLTLAILEHRLAEVHHRLGAWDVAESHLTAALNLLSTGGDPALRARVLADLALVAHRRGETDAATAAAQRALTAATEAADHAALAQAHDVLGVLASERGDVEPAERHLRESLVQAASLADPSYRVAALNNLSLLEAEVGRSGEAVELAREALRLGLEHGDRHRAAALHTNLADLLHATGEQAEALDHLTSAARLFAGVDDEEVRHPEIWKLSRW